MAPTERTQEVRTDRFVPPVEASGSGGRRLGPHRLHEEVRPALAPVIALGIIIVWSAHDGGYDADTWYWGALVLLSVLALSAGRVFGRVARLTPAAKAAIAAFALYVAWSYASMSWASYPGAALTGSNRALLYLLMFVVCARVPWTSRRAMWTLVAYALGVGAIGLVLLLQMALGENVGSLFTEGRLISPTGYFNSNAALFMMLALVGVALWARRELNPLLRGVLLALSCVGLVLALLAESRGWLFTMPVVLALALWAVRDRVVTVAAALVPVAGLLAVLSPLLNVYRVGSAFTPDPRRLARVTEHAGRMSLIAFGVVLLVGGLAALMGPRVLRRRAGWRAGKALSIALATLVVIVAAAGVTAVTHGHPGRFINRQWYGFTHPGSASNASSSHFASVGSQRYDFWRVAVGAFESQPVGGLGQDNFADYYVSRRRTDVEAEWTHSWELRILAHTGLVGALLFIGFLGAAITGAVRARRGSDPRTAAVVGVALLPSIVWLVHGSVDWFWEMPALSGPAIAFLAMGGALAVQPATASPAADHPRIPSSRFGDARWLGLVKGVAGVILVGAAAFVLGVSYLSVREVSLGSGLESTQPSAALSAFHLAGELNPFDSTPGRFAGTVALESGLYSTAEARFGQAIAREPEGWFAWMGQGLAASALGDRVRARRDFSAAARLDIRQPAVRQALDRVDSPHPLTVAQAFDLLVVAH